MSIIVLTTRFMLEIITVLGLFSGVFFSKTTPHKIVYLLLSIGITLVWARYGAPKSTSALTGLNKFILEVFVYVIGSVAFYKLFGNNIGTIYSLIVITNLILMYALGLQGN